MYDNGPKLVLLRMPRESSRADVNNFGLTDLEAIAVDLECPVKNHRMVGTRLNAICPKGFVGDRELIASRYHPNGVRRVFGTLRTTDSDKIAQYVSSYGSQNKEHL